MDSFEWNKVAASLLIGLLLFMGVTLLADGIFHGDEEVLVGLEGQPQDEQTQVVEAEPEANIMALIADANLASGERSFRKCQACHTIDQGGDHRVGPNLYGIVGLSVASKPGFSYSQALADKGGVWGYDELNTFLENPGKAVPGTKMSFAGLRNVDERANVIAYLRSQSENPIPLPEVQQASEEAADVVEGEATAPEDEAASDENQ